MYKRLKHQSKIVLCTVSCNCFFNNNRQLQAGATIGIPTLLQATIPSATSKAAGWNLGWNTDYQAAILWDFLIPARYIPRYFKVGNDLFHPHQFKHVRTVSKSKQTDISTASLNYQQISKMNK